MYSDSVTDSMKLALDETKRRREAQKGFNTEHRITPTSVKKNIADLSQFLYDGDPAAPPIAAEPGKDLIEAAELKALIAATEKKMVKLADDTEFEKAAVERDRLLLLRDMDLGLKPASRALLAEPKEQMQQRPMGKRAQPRKYFRKR
jgi:excinuclease ABC subunit B